jgi:hypothetical protein
LAGICPAAILQNRQLGSAAFMAVGAFTAASPGGR